MTKLKQSMKVLRFVAQLAVASQLAVSLAAAQTPGSIAIDCDQAAVNLRWSSVTGRSYMVYGTSHLTSLWSEVATVPKHALLGSRLNIQHVIDGEEDRAVSRLDKRHMKSVWLKGARGE